MATTKHYCVCCGEKAEMAESYPLRGADGWLICEECVTVLSAQQAQKKQGFPMTDPQKCRCDEPGNVNCPRHGALMMDDFVE